MSRKRGAKNLGTRSLTLILDEAGHEICVLYRQYDGYPSGHGAELKELLNGFSVVNGLGMGNHNKIANGVGCLAAQIVSNFKAEPGGFYVYPSGTRDCGEEYIYTVYLEKTGRKSPSRLFLKIQAGAVTFFGLPGTKQNHMPVIYDGRVEALDPEMVQRTWSNREEEPVNDFIDDQILSTEIIMPD